MTRHRRNRTSKNRSFLTFFSLVVVLSLPIWFVAAIAGHLQPGELLGNLPISSLMACCPLIAATIFVWREEGSVGVKKLLKRATDHRRIERKIWYVPIFLLWPALTVLEYGLMKLLRVPLPEPQIPVLTVLVSFVVFFIAALGEEVGWQGYAIEPLQQRWGALAASVILGIVWPLWHVVPFLQMNRTPAWIAWQCLYMVFARILYLWLYNNTGKSVFAVILFHAMHNVSTVVLPSYGWHYDPFVEWIFLVLVAAIVIFLWGPKTLAHYRYSGEGKRAQSSIANSPVPEAGP